MVAAMDLHMTIRARAVHELRLKSIHRSARRGLPWSTRVNSARVPQIGVTPLTEQRLLYDQKRLVRGAVRVVAIEAILTDGGVLKQERPTLLGMTVVAFVID